MITVSVPTFDEFNKYKFIKTVEVKIKNIPTSKDVGKITKYLPGIPQGAVGKNPLLDLITNRKKEITSFYDTRQNTKRLKGFYVIIK